MQKELDKISNYFGSGFQTKIVTYCSIGNLLELYDYVLFAVMLSVISEKFFPVGDPNTSIILGMLTFAISFLFAAFGSIFWGWYGDKYGRQKMLNLSMMIMAVPSFVIALLPTYEQVGFLAPLILIIARIMQGISASGEVQGAKIYAMETVESKALGASAGILSAAGGLGVLMAMLMAYLSSISHYENAWRIPFFIGSLIGYVGILLRKEHIKSKIQKPSTKNRIKVLDLVTILKNHKYESYSVFALGSILGSLSYMLHAFMTPYMINIGFSSNDAYLFVILSLASTIIFSIISGFYADINHKIVPIIRKNILFIIISIIPSFMLILSKNSFLTATACIVLGGLLGINACICGIIMYKAFPYETRCRGVMFLYALSVSIFGGFTPLILKSLALINYLYPAYFMIFLMIIMYMVFNYSVNKINLNGNLC